MTTSPPPEGSAWARYCPDAYPFEWIKEHDLNVLPPGYTRFASNEEADLITKKITVEDFLNKTKRPTNPPSGGGEGGYQAGQPRRGRSSKKSSQRASVAKRFKELSEFMRYTHAGLKPAERAVWFAVFTFTQEGRAIVTQTKMAAMAGMKPRSITRAVGSLVRRGLLEVVEQGCPGRSSVYRYRATVEPTEGAQ